MQPKRIIPIEPNPVAIDLLKQNIELNQIANVDTSLLGFGIGDKRGQFDLVIADNANIGAARLEETSTGSVKVYPLDEKLKDKVDFIKIDVEWMEMEVLRGATQLIKNSRPIIFIEIMNANTNHFKEWAENNQYKVIKIFPYVNAQNFIVAPINHPLSE
jgi:FkbM family methyltransferase